MLPLYLHFIVKNDEFRMLFGISLSIKVYHYSQNVPCKRIRVYVKDLMGG